MSVAEKTILLANMGSQSVTATWYKRTHLP